MENIELKNMGNNVSIITVDGVDNIFSYSSNIMQIKGKEIIAVGKHWDYSTTTSKHLNMCLRKLGLSEVANMTRAQKEKHFIKLGII